VRVLIIVVILIAALFGWLYFGERETFDKLVGKDEPAGSTAPAPDVKPGREATAPRRKTKRAAEGTLILPDFPAPVYVNGEPRRGGESISLEAGPVTLSALTGEGYVHETLSLREGESVTAKLERRPARPPVGWTAFQGNTGRTGHVGARNRDSLEPVWQLALDQRTDCSPIVINGTVLLSTRKSLVTAIDLAAGEVLWSQGSMGGTVSPVATEDYAFAVSNTGQLEGYLLKNGRRRGDHSLSSYPTGSALISEEAFLVSTIASQVIRVKTKRSFTGRLPLRKEWETDVPELASGAGEPVIVGGTAIFPTERGLVALAVEGGARLWPDSAAGKAADQQVEMVLSVSDETRFRTPTPAADGDVVYAALGETLRAVGVDDGEPRWQVGLDEKVTSSVSSAHGLIYLGCSDGAVEARSSRDGRLVFRVRHGRGPIFASPVLFADKLLVATSEGKLILCDAMSGQAVTEADELSGTAIMSTPAVTDDAILAVDEQGRVVCYR